MKKKYITKFRSYDELPFPEKIQEELFKRHQHIDIDEGHVLFFNDGDIVYKEEDVLILLQQLIEEIN